MRQRLARGGRHVLCQWLHPPFSCSSYDQHQFHSPCPRLKLTQHGSKLRPTSLHFPSGSSRKLPPPPAKKKEANPSSKAPKVQGAFAGGVWGWVDPRPCPHPHPYPHLHPRTRRDLRATAWPSSVGSSTASPKSRTCSRPTRSPARGSAGPSARRCRTSWHSSSWPAALSPVPRAPVAGPSHPSYRLYPWLLPPFP